MMKNAPFGGTALGSRHCHGVCGSFLSFLYEDLVPQVPSLSGNF